jgi:tRNA threonylcarbamoyladenosine biosynthesis protein TsaE
MTEPFKSVLLRDETQTMALGARLAWALKAGDFIALTGNLGAGKTTLSRGLIRAFVGGDIEVPSPTFTLVQTYQQNSATTAPASDTGLGLDLFHFDLYRLKSADEVWELGWEEIEAGIALVEWPDRAQAYLPETRLDIVLAFEGTGRIAHFFSPKPQVWKDRLNGA